VKVTSVEFVTSAVESAGWPAEAGAEFAFIGRSNVGKSSLLNRLCGRRDLARVSAKPGATRTINFFRVNRSIGFVDLPGYGYSKASQGQRDEFRSAVSEYLAERASLRCVLVLIDGRHEPQALDLDFCQWLGEAGIPFVLVFTKADKVKPRALEANLGAFVEAMSERLDGEPRVFAVSAKTGQGLKELLQFLGRAAE